MKKWQQGPDKPPEIFDEHNEPTEPLPPLPMQAFVDSNTLPDAPTEPFVQPPLVLSNPLYHPASASIPAMPVDAQAELPPLSYPMLPDLPNERQEAPSLTTKGPKRSMTPQIVGLCFVAVQLLLLIRFVLKMINFSADTTWVGVIYAISNLFVFPFDLLMQSIKLPITINVEFYTLLAILIYGFLSRLLVKLLKALRKS